MSQTEARALKPLAISICSAFGSGKSHDLGVISIYDLSSSDASIANFRVICEYQDGVKYEGIIQGMARSRGYYHLFARAFEVIQEVQAAEAERDAPAKEQNLGKTTPCMASWAPEGASWTKQCEEPSLPGKKYCSTHAVVAR